MKKAEDRYVLENSHLRAFVEDDKKIVEGRALVFNSPSRLLYEDRKEFNEVIEDGALQETDFSRAYLTYNHSKDDVFATVKGGSLTPMPDGEGMLFRAILNNTQKANDMYELVRGGDIAGLSFNMVVSENDYTYSRGTDGKLVRTIHRIRAIKEISLIGGLWEPAYPDTMVWARGLDEYMSREQMEQAQKEQLIAERKKFTERKIDIYKKLAEVEKV
jgi:HK97 family phage prohead protease